MVCLNAEDCLPKTMTLDSGIVADAHFYNIHSFIQYSFIIHLVNRFSCLEPFLRMIKQCYQGNLWQENKPPTYPKTQSSFKDKIEKGMLGKVHFYI